MFTDPRIAGLIRLVTSAIAPPKGPGRIALALTMGVVCHTAFALGVLAMMVAMFYGMSESLGQVPWPWAIAANAILLAQFPLAHSWFLTGRGGRWLERLVPGPHGKTLATTTYN